MTHDNQGSDPRRTSSIRSTTPPQETRVLKVPEVVPFVIRRGPTSTDGGGTTGARRPRARSVRSR